MIPIPPGRFRVLLGTLGLFAALPAMRPAHAQIINQYFPPIGAPAGGTPEANDLTRVLQSFAPTGARFGSFLVQGDVGEAAGYDTNVDGLPGGASSAVFDTTGALSVQSQWSRNAVNAGVSVDDARFPSRSTQDRTNWTATAGGQYDLGRDQLGASYTHLNLVQLPTDLGASASLQRIPYQVDEGALTYTAVTRSPLTLLPGIDLTQYRFGGGAVPLIGTTSGEAAVSQSYRDRLTAQESLTARYELSTDDALLLVGRGTEISYDHGLAGIPDRDSHGFAVLGGIDLHDGGPIAYRALVGYQQRDYDSRAYSTIRAPIAEAQLAWSPTRLTTVSATVTNGIEDGAFENVVGFTATAATLRVQHRYERNVTLGGYLDVQQASYPATPTALSGSVLAQSPSNQTLFGGGLDAEWLVNRHLRVRASYDVSDQNDVTGRRFVTNEVLLSVHLVL